MSESNTRLCRRQECFQGAGRTGLCSEHLQDTLNTYSLPELINMAVDLLESGQAPEPDAAAAPDGPVLN